MPFIQFLSWLVLSFVRNTTYHHDVLKVLTCTVHTFVPSDVACTQQYYQLVKEGSLVRSTSTTVQYVQYSIDCPIWGTETPKTCFLFYSTFFSHCNNNVKKTNHQSQSYQVQSYCIAIKSNSVSEYLSVQSTEKQ